MQPSSILVTEADRRQESVDKLKLPLRAIVERPIPDLEAVEVGLVSESSTTRLKVRHPYMGVNSWIRVMPDKGTSVFTMQRGDAKQTEIMAYGSNALDEQTKQGRDGKIIYRTLDEGEIELMSSGRAYLFLGSAGDIEMRGGVIRQEMLQSQLEHRMEAPTYTRRLSGAMNDTLKHQERFGIVRRPDTNFPNVLYDFIRTPTNEFAVEYMRVLHTKDNKPLVELQEGHVYDETGQVINQASTNKPLRYKKTISDDAGNTLFTEVDDTLNILIDNNSKAPETKVNLGSKNVLSLTSQDVKLNIIKTGTYQYGTSLTETAPKTVINAATSFTVKSAKAHLKAPLTHFGDSPSIPIALGPPTLSSATALINTLQGFFAIAAADTGLGAAASATHAAALVVSNALPAALTALNNIPSKQVFASG